MDFRSMIDQVKSAFVIGKSNTFLHGGVPGRQEAQSQYVEQQNPAPSSANPQNYQAYQNTYGQQANPYAPQQQGYGQPDAYGQMQQGQAYASYPQQGPNQQAQPYQYATSGQGYGQPAAQAPRQQADSRPAAGFATQMDPFAQDSGRNRRSRQHQETGQPEAAYPQQAMHENIVQFPGTAAQPQQEPATGGIDAYVINVFNINSCRQAMSCLRKGQCTLIVMDQLVDKAEIRRYVDMLTGACYALSGTMTRLSSKIGFYIMAPAGMTVYTDPTTSNANTPPSKPPQTPLYQPPSGQGYPGSQAAHDFSQRSAYPPAPQMNFSTQQIQPQSRQNSYQQPYSQEQGQSAAPAISPYANDHQRQAAQ